MRRRYALSVEAAPVRRANSASNLRDSSPAARALDERLYDWPTTFSSVVAAECPEAWGVSFDLTPNAPGSNQGNVFGPGCSKPILAMFVQRARLIAEAIGWLHREVSLASSLICGDQRVARGMSGRAGVEQIAQIIYARTDH